jgi:hypothetical protein
MPPTIRPTPAAWTRLTVSPRKPKPRASAKGEAVVKRSAEMRGPVYWIVAI